MYQSKPWQTLLVLSVLILPARFVTAEQFEAFTEPYKRVAVPSPELGVISEILVKEGDEVTADQLLARLDDSVLQASLEVARSAKDAQAAMQSAELEVEMRRKHLESYRQLHERGNATHRELERAEHELQQASSRLQSVREDLDMRRLEYARVQTQLKRRVIDSPISGFVVAIDKEVGEFVAPTDPIIMHVVHLKSLKAVFSIPLTATVDLRSGQTVQLTVGVDNVSCDGVIEFVSPIADAESGTRRVKVKIPNSDRAIQSGISCHWDAAYEAPTNKMTRRSPDSDRSLSR